MELGRMEPGDWSTRHMPYYRDGRDARDETWAALRAAIHHIDHAINELERASQAVPDLHVIGFLEGARDRISRVRRVDLVKRRGIKDDLDHYVSSATANALRENGLHTAKRVREAVRAGKGLIGIGETRSREIRKALGIAEPPPDPGHARWEVYRALLARDGNTGKRIASALATAGITTVQQITGLHDDELLAVHGIGPGAVELLRTRIAERQ